MRSGDGGGLERGGELRTRARTILQLKMEGWGREAKGKMNGRKERDGGREGVIKKVEMER